jgi:hypothetical protein
MLNPYVIAVSHRRTYRCVTPPSWSATIAKRWRLQPRRAPNRRQLKGEFEVMAQLSNAVTIIEVWCSGLASETECS